MLLAVFLLSAALLAYQIALVHLLSITHWTHFAALVISLALLGFGASGSLLALGRRRVAGRERRLLTLAVLLAALSFDPLYRLATRIPFDAFELLAVPRQFLYLSLTYLVLSVPFFLGAAAIALALSLARRDVARVYAANLVGSGAGAAVGLVLVGLLPAERLPAVVGLLGALAVVPLAPALSLVPVGVTAVALAFPPPLPISKYKDESMALAQPGARVLARRDGALGRLSLVAAPALRYLPGASLALTEPVPPRPVLYLNGQPLGFRAVPSDTALIAMTTQAAAFAVPRIGETVGPEPRRAGSEVADQNPGADGPGAGDAPPREALLIGLAGGGEVWYARARGADEITVVDPDPRIDDLLTPGTLGPDVRRIASDPRAFLRARSQAFDTIVITQLGSLGAASAGMAAAGEDYLFTVQGMRDLYGALEPAGVLAVTRWVLEPPRDVLRLLATVRGALDELGESAADRVALVRGWGTATLLVTRRPFTDEQVASVRRWAEERWFDIAWAPGVTDEEANRFNQLEPDVFRLGAKRLLGPEPDRFIESYPFEIAPVTDDAPFFFHFLPISDLGRLWRAEGRLGLAYFEWGLIAQVLALAQAVPLAAVLILLPLAALRRRAPDPGSASESAVEPPQRSTGAVLDEAVGPQASRPAAARPNRAAVGPGNPDPDPPRPGSAAYLFLYFALLGAGYMLLEISFIQRLVLFLAQPLYAATAVLTAFLVFAGLGSALAPRVAMRYGRWLPFAAIALLGPIAFVLQRLAWDLLPGAALPVRVVLAVGLLAPLAFFMGMPFPLGLQQVADRRREWLPWCWGVNGYLSVIGAAAAPLVALGLGFRGVLLLAIVLYLAARWTLERV